MLICSLSTLRAFKKIERASSEKELEDADDPVSEKKSLHDQSLPSILLPPQLSRVPASPVLGPVKASVRDSAWLEEQKRFMAAFEVKRAVGKDLVELLKKKKNAEDPRSAR